jgi:catechol 2,3-dioxygenase-like lactoylglutathione lyase family enzyme
VNAGTGGIPIPIRDVQMSGVATGASEVLPSVDISTVMAQMIVTDLDRSVEFYSRLFGRAPDASPMDGLREWHVEGAGAIQVYEEPDRAGRSGVTLHVGDLEGAVASLDAAGIAHEPIAEATFVRVVELVDPDDNRIVVTGAPAAAGG